MKFKMAILITFGLLAIMTIGAITASDINETSNDAISINEHTLEVNESNNPNIQSSVDDEILGDGEGYFSEVQTMINGANTGDTIELSKNYLGSGTQITVNKEVIIDGKNSILDANYASRIFRITSSNVVIKNIKFINGNSTSSNNYDGGAIRWEGANGTILNCSFVNCSAPKDDGGAIHWEGIGGTVSNCSFINCSAYDTGAILWNAADGDIRDSIFINCFVTFYGSGAIELYFKGNNVNISNCTFINCFQPANSTTGGTGGITCRGVNGSVSNCTFINCSAFSAGGIMWSEDNGTVDGCIFVNCSSNSLYGAGAILWFDDYGLISNCSFENCYYINKNGAIVESWNDNLLISNSKFESSTIGDITTPINRGIISNCTFNGMQLTSFEYLQYLINNVNDTLTLNYDHYGNGNQITISKRITIDGKGHAIDANGSSQAFYINAENVVLKNIVFKNGYGEEGGAIYFKNMGNVTNCNFTNNKATDDGGAVYFEGTGTVLNCNFTNNTARSGGAIIMNSGNLTNCNFTDNQASRYGGAVYFQNTGTVLNCNFTGNTANSEGGAIFFYSDSKGNVTNCNFTGNKATGTYSWGGAIRMGFGTVSNCNFINNSAILCGGAAFLINGTMINCTFINNSAASGDAVAWENATEFIPSEYLGTGGAIWFGGLGTVENCKFTDNSAMQGGAIYFNEQSGGNVINCNFINCSAELGKAIYANSITLISNCNFETQGSESLSELVEGGITSNCTVNGKKEKTATNMTIITEDITYGENATITVIMTTDGTVTVNINNQNIGLEITNGTGQITIPNLNVGEYIVKASFEGNSDYESANATTTLTVAKAQSQLTIQPIPETAYGEDINIIINVQNDATGTITLTVNGENYIKNIENGQTTFNITGLDAGNYEAIANYAGDSNYLASQNSTQFTVKSNMKTFEDITDIISNAHAGDTINLEGTYYGTGSTITINKELTIKGNGETILDAKNLSGILSVSANNVRINNIRFINGKINSNGGAINWIGKNGTISNCTFINCSAENGGSVYWNAENGMINTSTFDHSTATSNGGAIYWNANNGEITDSIFTNSHAQNGGAVYVPENRNVEIKSSIFDSNMAKEESGAVYGGTVDDDCAFKNNTYTPLNTTTIISINETAVYAGNDISITTLILSQKGGLVNTGTVEIYINSKLIATIPANTAYIYKTGNLGTYQVLAKFNDDSSYKDSSSTAEFTVIPVDIPEEIETSTAGIFTLEFPDDAEGTLTVFIDGTKYKVYDIIGGILKIDLSDKKGKYNITFEYSGDNNYPAFKKDANVTVETNPSITASNAKVIYSAGTTYKITVYKNKGITANGVNVVIKQNNKAFKTIKTNSKGIASFKITQTPGTYKLKITSLGKTVTKTLTVKHIVTLKTATVKKSAKKLILQASLAKINKKYLKKKTVTFKFNGKTYKAKTNSKGIAKITIKSNVLKKLKVGKKITYQATYLKDTVKKTAKVKK